MWSGPSNLWLHLSALWRYLRATCTFPNPSSIIATFIYVAAVFGCDGPHVRCSRYKARLTYLNKQNIHVYQSNARDKFQSLLSLSWKPSPWSSWFMNFTQIWSFYHLDFRMLKNINSQVQFLDIFALNCRT